MDSQYADVIKNNRQLPDENLFNVMKYELDHHIYSFGDHFKNPYENRSQILKSLKMALGVILNLSRNLGRENFGFGHVRIMSNAYSTFNSRLTDYDFHACLTPWNNAYSVSAFPDFTTKWECEKLKFRLGTSVFKQLLDASFSESVRRYQKSFEASCIRRSIVAAVLANDMGLFERLAIESFRKLKRPSFVMLHGIPARYNCIDDNKADYLLVWGEKIKEHYVGQGVSSSKIFVTGHPELSGKPKPSRLRFSLNDILVTTLSLNSAPHSTGLILADRAALIVYLLEIQSALIKLGVEKVRLRVHPSENPKWYMRFIDQNFFQLDFRCLAESLRKSTLVIGPSSTVLFEAIQSGVNYLVFEPSNDGRLNAVNNLLVPPFDGSDSRVPVVFNHIELMQLIREKKSIDPSVFNDYIQTSFDLNCLKNILN